jgi:hypothetical protein
MQTKFLTDWAKKILKLSKALKSMEAVNDGSSFVMSYAMERLTNYLRSILMHNEPNQEIETKQMILPYRSHTDDV